MATSTSSRWLKSTEWLAGQLGKPGVSIVDGSYYLPTQKRDAEGRVRRRAYSRRGLFRHQRHRRRFNRPAAHAARTRPVRRRGQESSASPRTTRSSFMIAADFSAPRVWWTFRIFGARNVFILDGGLPVWKQEGRPVDAGEVKRPKRTFNADMDTGAVAMVSDVQMALNDSSVQVVDARFSRAFRRHRARAPCRTALRSHAGRTQRTLD